MNYDAVMLIAFGGPNKFEDVRPFLANVLKGIPVPPERVETVVEQYRAIGGVSPLNEITFSQARALEALLSSRGTPLKVYVGMRNWDPYIKDTLEKMKKDGVRNAAGIILAPHKSEASWDRYVNAILEAREQIGSGAPEINFRPSWHNDPIFIEAVSDRVREVSPPAGSHLIFTAHSIPAAMDQKSDYSGQVLETAGLVARRLGAKDWHVAYQSRSGRPQDPWLEPDAGDLIRRLSSEGVRSVVLVPVGFVCDHVEVLYDLDVKARKAAEETGVRFARAKTVGAHPKFIEMLAGLVKRAQSSPQPRHGVSSTSPFQGEGVKG